MRHAAAGPLPEGRPDRRATKIGAGDFRGRRHRKQGYFSGVRFLGVPVCRTREPGYNEDSISNVGLDNLT